MRDYGSVRAVEPLDLEVDAGECLGFLGPNGAGKTTVTRMLTGLIAPSAGSAVILGHDLEAGARHVRRTVGVLTEQPGLYKRLSARENLRFYARLYGLSSPEARIDDYLKRLDLWAARDRPAATYSRGMAQKVAIIRALLHEPELVFLDEPTSGLDVESALTVRDFILTLKGEGRTVFLCTHNLDEAERVCDRVAVFRRRILALGPADQLRLDLSGRQVAIRLEQEGRDPLAALSRLPFVRQAHFAAGELVTTLDDPQSQTADVVRVLVECGARVQAVRAATASLEEVYLKLVDGPSR